MPIAVDRTLLYDAARCRFMTSGRIVLPALLVAAALAWACPVPAHVNADGVLSGDRKRETLRDLTGVQVIVEPLAGDAERDGLTAETLQRTIESQLAAAGIRVLSEEERRSQPGFPFLYIGVTTVKAAAVYSYAIDISLNQTVNLTRHPTIATFAPTWTAQATGVVSDSHLSEVTDHVRIFIARFIKDYWEMNGPEEARLHVIPRPESTY
jgi:hypothetical protein